VRSLLQPGTRKENNYEVFHSTHQDGEQGQKTARRGSSCGTPLLSADLAQNPAMLIKTYRGFPQSAQANARLVFKIKQEFSSLLCKQVSVSSRHYTRGIERS
jgi:hypothetical protein